MVAKGSKLSEETKRKISEARKRYYANLTDEEKKQLYEGHKGWHHTEEAKEKISLATRGKNNPMYGRHRYGKDAPCYGNKGWHHTQETKNKMKVVHKERLEKMTKEEKISLYGSFKNRKHTEKTKIKMSESAKKRVRGPFSEKGKENIRKGIVKGFLDGTRNYSTRPKFYVHGYFDSEKNNRKLWYRSSLELKYYKLLEDSPFVISFEAEPFGIPYITNEKERSYIPDLLITFLNRKKLLVEIKPKRQVPKQINQDKFKAARKYASKNNMKFVVWTERMVA